MSKVGQYENAKKKLDILFYKFFSNEGDISRYLISKLARFERFMAIDNVFEKILPLVPKCKNSIFFGFSDIW